jgi:ADP-dependent NAD(P)H-hydrate dehydratase / NAD(P)H-hydrate epimerase
MHLLTAAEMRAVDRATIAAGTPGERLMQRAGEGVAEGLERRWGSPLALRVLVLAGGGNNGGDGLVAARALAARGARVAVAVCAPREHVRGDARVMLERFEQAGGLVRFVDGPDALSALVAMHDHWDFALDALLGTGAEGGPRGLVADACRLVNDLHARGTRVLAVDLPTGVGSDDGSVAPGAVHADATVTFGHPKRGHWLWPGRGLCGELEVVDIGLVSPEQAGVQPAELASARALAACVPVRDPRAHKGVTGRAFLVGGAPGMTGAMVLAAQAATRAGAGYVRVAAPASLQAILAAHLVEPMVLACGEDEHRTLTTSALPLILSEAERADAVAVGPGLSRNPHAASLARELATHLARPLVIDADALTALSPAEDVLVPALRLAPAPRILTPHLGEMSRLTGQSHQELESRRIDATKGWAQRWGAVVVLKGAPTVVAAPDGRVSVNPTGSPALATAGTGDVLTGTIVALLAQGLAPFDAARLAVFAHGMAGEMAGTEVGDVGATATDVVARIPRALARIRATR